MYIKKAIMRIYIEFIIVLTILVFCYQFYSLSVSSVGQQRQERCQKLGIAFMTLGITSLVFRSVPFVFLGLMLMMFGFRLLAKGLDRLEKKIFIDQHEDDK